MPELSIPCWLFPRPTLLAAACIALAACDAVPGSGSTAPRNGTGPTAAGERWAGRLVISEVMPDPRAVPDERGEWLEIANVGTASTDLRGWRLRSGGDAGMTVARSLVVPPGGAVVLARDGREDANGGVRADYRLGEGLTLANTADWVALVDRGGRTVDSATWTRPPRRGASWARRTTSAGSGDAGGEGWAVSTAAFGQGDRGTPGHADLAASEGVLSPSPAERETVGAGEEPAESRGTEADAGGGAVYRDHVEFGIPRDDTSADDHLLRRPQYVLSYNPRRGQPNWVSWNLNRTHFGSVPRSPSFQSDPSLPARFPRVMPSDYTGSGYSRGHMVRSEERTATAEDNAATFLMTNIVPQHQDLNAGPWLDLERHLQEQAQRRGREIYVVSGPAFVSEPETLRGRGRVQVPASTWKVAVLLPYGQGLADVRSARDLEVIAVEMPNVAGIAGRPWTAYRTTVDALERKTGYDLLDRLPDEIEKVVEARR